MAIEIAPPKPLPDRALPDRALPDRDLPDRDLPEQGLPDTHKRRRDSRALWRLCCWGGLAAIALAALAFTTQTESGSRRLQLAFGAANQPARAIAMADVTLRALEKDAETQRLEAQVRLLAADRDRLDQAAGSAGSSRCHGQIPGAGAERAFHHAAGRFHDTRARHACGFVCAAGHRAARDAGPHGQPRALARHATGASRDPGAGPAAADPRRSCAGERTRGRAAA